MSRERCRCGTCRRFIGHTADDDHSCSRCCNAPVWREGSDWQPEVCGRCRGLLRDDYDPPVPY